MPAYCLAFHLMLYMFMRIVCFMFWRFWASRKPWPPIKVCTSSALLFPSYWFCWVILSSQRNLLGRKLARASEREKHVSSCCRQKRQSLRKHFLKIFLWVIWDLSIACLIICNLVNISEDLGLSIMCFIFYFTWTVVDSVKLFRNLNIFPEDAFKCISKICFHL